MAIFLITPLGANFDQLGQAIREGLPEEDHMALQGRAGYLAVFGGTTVELSHKLRITSLDKDAQLIGSAMVTTVGSYYGRGPTTMWEWLKSRIER